MTFHHVPPGRTVAASGAAGALHGILTALLLLLPVAPSRGQDATQSYIPYAFPRTMGLWELRHRLSLGQAELPEDIIETDDVFRSPLLSYHIRCGLGGHFLIEGGFSSNVVTWHFMLGPKFVIEYECLHVAAGYDIAYWYGRLDQFGFDTKLEGWIHYPNLSIGHRFNGFTLTAEGRLIVVTAQHYRVGDMRVPKEFDTVPGLSLALFLEQPLWKDNVVILGGRMYWTTFYYPSWAAFSTFDRHFWIPELIFGFVL